MQILKRQQPLIAKKWIYLIALVFSLVVLAQSSGTNADGELELNLFHIILFTLNYLVWAFLISWVYGASNSLESFHKISAISLIELLINSVIIVVLHFIISNLLYYMLLFVLTDINVERAIITFKSIIFRALTSRTIDYVVILAILKIIDTYQALFRQKLQVVQLENQLHTAHLESLKAQLNPHFLFNALHVVHTLIGHDDDKAKTMTIKISNLLRKMLNRQHKNTVTLDEELDHLRDYMDIEQERFHDRLTIDYDIEESTRNVVVPNLILQPLAENAFKHGISLLENKGVISITSRMDNDMLIIEMSNTIADDDRTTHVKSTNIGLSNLRSRLQQFYDDDYELVTVRIDNNFKVILKINTYHIE